ncbi:MAG: hypothetical protein ACR2F6_03260 [Mycobacteriales bacterium]
MDGELRAQFGTAKHPSRPVEHERPTGAGDATIDAVGKLSEALEVVENARGHLYAFHRLSGHADLTLQQAVEDLRDAGHAALADEIDDVLVGRDVVPGNWTFQIVEAYDDSYWSVFRSVERVVRDRLVSGLPHVYEAEMKRREQQ